MKIDGFLKRDTLTHYPAFQRYQILDVLGVDVVMNGRGHAILLYRITAPENDAQAWDYYQSDESFYKNSYSDCLQAFRELTSAEIIDFDDTFYVVLGADRLEISWDILRLPLTGPDDAALNVFFEAMFVYGLCRNAEKLLGSLLDDKGVVNSTEQLIGHAQDLVFIEKPEHFLVNKQEITLMEEFYRVWKIGDDAVRLQTRFGQIIETFNLRFNQVQAQRGMTLNRIAAAVAVLALISTAEPLSKMLGGVKVEHLQVVFAAIAMVLLGWALVPDLVRSLHLNHERIRSRAVIKRMKIFK